MTNGDPDRKLSLLMTATNELKAKAAAIGANVLILEGSEKDPATGNVTLFGNAISVPD